MAFLEINKIESSNERMILEWWRDKFFALASNCMLSIDNVYKIQTLDTDIRQNLGCIEAYGKFQGKNGKQYEFSIIFDTVKDKFIFCYNYYTKKNTEKRSSCNLLNFRRIMDWFFFALNSPA